MNPLEFAATVGARVAQLPKLLESLFASVRRIETVTHELVAASTKTLSLRAERTSYVYIIPKEGPMLAQAVQLSEDTTVDVQFQSVVPLEAGAWVVATGPAHIEAVRVGNTMQTAWHDYNGQVCQLQDAIMPGILAVVKLSRRPPRVIAA